MKPPHNWMVYTVYTIQLWWNWGQLWFLWVDQKWVYFCERLTRPFAKDSTRKLMRSPDTGDSHVWYEASFGCVHKWRYIPQKSSKIPKLALKYWAYERRMTLSEPRGFPLMSDKLIVLLKSTTSFCSVNCQKTWSISPSFSPRVKFGSEGIELIVPCIC